MEKSEIHKHNKNYWDQTANEWFGATSLPRYGCYIPTEDELNLFGDVKGLNILDIGCGSGHSLVYHGKNSAKELWGLDMSTTQIANAREYMKDNNLSAVLINAPMETDSEIPQNYFDIVYSIYAIGWTTNLQKTFKLIHSYLKTNGVFIFSWDHPILRHIETREEELIFSGNYFNEEWYSYVKDGHMLNMCTRKISTYINALVDAGFHIEKLIEETDDNTLISATVIKKGHYSPHKAKKLPLSFIIKARKL